MAAATAMAKETTAAAEMVTTMAEILVAVAALAMGDCSSNCHHQVSATATAISVAAVWTPWLKGKSVVGC